MSRPDFRTKRLFVPDPLAAGAAIALDRGRTNYLVNVLRMGAGDPVQLFNGRDGEWLARIAKADRKGAELALDRRIRPQPAPGDLHYLFAPLKQARLDYMVQKATEMGASRIAPVLTEFTQVSRLNLDRLAANVIEAAEQCGVLAIPEIAEPRPLDKLLDAWGGENAGRRLVFCDEGEDGDDPLQILAALAPGPLAVLIGPEGGFSDKERQALREKTFVTAIPLGPRILRADTAAVAALALVQAALGDWR